MSHGVILKSVMHFKNSDDICKEKYSTSKHGYYCSTGNNDKQALKYEPETRIEAILPAKSLGKGICVNTVVEYASEQEKESQEHNHQNVI